MKKKVLALVLMMAMVFSLVACGDKKNNNNNNNANPDNQEQDNTTPDDTNTPDDTTPEGEDNTDNTTPEGDDVAGTPTVGGQLIIGDVTQSNGDVYPYWTNNASDYFVYQVVFGAGTMEINRDGQYVENPNVVEKMEKVNNEDGSMTVTYKLQENMKWSNGEPITAKDYAFHLMFFSSPVLVELGAQDNTSGYYLKGWEAFSTGESKVFPGVRLLGDYEFAITIDASQLPFYFEDALADYSPSYMKGWMPADVDIIDDGEGCYFTDTFTTANVKEQVENYRMHLDAFSGPYMVDNYDETSNTYTLKINPEYTGNFEGQKPYIETVLYKYVISETMMDELATGGVDMLTGVMEGDEINAGLDLVDAGTHNYEEYARNGFGRLIFICDRGPTQFEEVRRAVAYLLDRNDFCRTITGGHGLVAHGLYGVCQWMVEEAEEEIGALNMYNKSLESAISELEAGGWVYDKDGNDYTSGIRYKKLDDGTLMPLILEWCSSEKNSVSDLLATMLANGEDTAAAGMQINQTVVSFNELNNNYYQLQENNYNMYNMGVGFTPVNNWTETYKPGGGSNRNLISDEQLATLAAEMVRVPAGDDEAYLEKWLAFQKRYNEILPDLPLYANQYFDFYNAKLKGYTGIKSALWELESQLIYSWIEE